MKEQSDRTDDKNVQYKRAENTARSVAYGGIFAAVSVVLIMLGSVIQSNTLFLLALASFLQGILVRKFGVPAAAASTFAASAAGLLLSPEKLYCLTFAEFSVYVITAEYFRKRELRMCMNLRSSEADSSERYHGIAGGNTADDIDSEYSGANGGTAGGHGAGRLKKMKVTEWVIKFFLFNILFLISALTAGYITGFSTIVNGSFLKNIKSVPLIITVVIAAGEAAWILFDRIYIYFQERIVSRYMKNFLQN